MINPKELSDRGLPVVYLDARYANAALKMRPNKTDKNDAAGLAQIVRTGWFNQVCVKTRGSYQVRALLSDRYGSVAQATLPADKPERLIIRLPPHLKCKEPWFGRRGSTL